MKQALSIILFLVFAITGFAATAFSKAGSDSFPKVKVITKGGKIIIGRLLYLEDHSIHILPGNNKE